MSNVEIMNRGMKCLLENLVDIETEEFIMTIKRDKFDYTEWQQTLFEGMTLEEINDAAVAYAKEHPFEGKAVRV